MRKFRSDAKPINIDLAKDMYLKKGLSLHKVAKFFNIHHTNLMMRFRRFGIPTRNRKEAARAFPQRGTSGPLNPGWKGGITKRKDGYFIRNSDKRYIHRLIAERVLGRKLKQNEAVHHIDGNRSNNEPSNLFVCTKSYHAWLHAEMQGFKIGINHGK